MSVHIPRRGNTSRPTPVASKAPAAAAPMTLQDIIASPSVDAPTKIGLEEPMSTLTLEQVITVGGEPTTKTEEEQQASPMTVDEPAPAEEIEPYVAVGGVLTQRVGVYDFTASRIEFESRVDARLAKQPGEQLDVLAERLTGYYVVAAQALQTIESIRAIKTDISQSVSGGAATVADVRALVRASSREHEMRAGTLRDALVAAARLYADHVPQHLRELLAARVKQDVATRATAEIARLDAVIANAGPERTEYVATREAMRMLMADAFFDKIATVSARLAAPIEPPVPTDDSRWAAIVDKLDAAELHEASECVEPLGMNIVELLNLYYEYCDPADRPLLMNTIMGQIYGMTRGGAPTTYDCAFIYGVLLSTRVISLLLGNRPVTDATFQTLMNLRVGPGDEERTPVMAGASQAVTIQLFCALADAKHSADGRMRDVSFLAADDAYVQRYLDQQSPFE